MKDKENICIDKGICLSINHGILLYNYAHLSYYLISFSSMSLLVFLLFNKNYQLFLFLMPSFLGGSFLKCP